MIHLVAAHDPDDGIWGPVLLTSLSSSARLGLLLSVLMSVDEDAGPSDGLYCVVMAGVGPSLSSRPRSGGRLGDGLWPGSAYFS